MRIIERIANSLFSPMRVLNYRFDKKWLTALYFFVIAIFMMIPSIIVLFTTPILSYNTELQIRSAFIQGGDIPYEIVDNTLVYNSTDEEKDYYLISNGNYDIYFTTKDNILLGTGNDINRVQIVFTKTAILMGNSLAYTTLAQYSDYENINGLNFKNVSESVFWEQAFGVVREIISDYSGYIVTISVIVIVIQSMFSVFILSLLLTLFTRFGSPAVLGFSQHWQLTIYYMTPFVFCNVLAILFNFGILVYVGLILSIVYSYRINALNGFGGNNNDI